MININFFRENGLLKGFNITGHAGYDEYGKDIVCSAVTSSIMLSINTITEFFKIPAKVDVEENKITLDSKRLSDFQSQNLNIILSSLKKHLELINEEYNRLNIS
jgi:uncharacterized protein YsxB (DUF464 family)